MSAITLTLPEELAERARALADGPPEQILALRPSRELQQRLTELLAKSRDSGLTAEEAREWQAYEYAEHLVRIAKVSALSKLPGR